MESRYFLFPGQTLENTKISDRVHALHITESEWGKVRKHLDRKKDIQELLDKEESKRRILSEGNKAMTEKWENTLEKMRMKKDESRAKTSEEIQEEKIQKFYVMREEQEKLQKQYIENIRKKMFRTSGICNDLNSAFVASEVLFEREKQKQLKDFLKKHEEEIEAKYAKIVKEEALKEVEENKEKAKKLLEKQKEYGAYLKEVIQEQADKKIAKKERKIIRENKDNLEAVEEMERIKKVQEEEKMKRKKEITAEMEKIMKNRTELQKQLKQEEKEIDEVVEIYREAKHIIDCMKKEKEKELQNDIIQRRQIVVNLLGSAEKSKIEEEERRIKVAIAERDAVEEAKIKAKAEYEEKMKKELIEERENVLKRKEIQKKKEAEVKKWEMLNVFKVDEVTKKYEEQKKKELLENILKYRQDLLEQIDEVNEENKRQQSFVCSESGNIEIQDSNFFEYADEILEYAKKRGRSTYPIEKAILEYKKINNMMPRDVVCIKGKEKGKNEPNKSLSKQLIENSVKHRPCRCTLRKK